MTLAQHRRVAAMEVLRGPVDLATELQALSTREKHERMIVLVQKMVAPGTGYTDDLVARMREAQYIACWYAYGQAWAVLTAELRAALGLPAGAT